MDWEFSSPCRVRCWEICFSICRQIMCYNYISCLFFVTGKKQGKYSGILWGGGAWARHCAVTGWHSGVPAAAPGLSGSWLPGQLQIRAQTSPKLLPGPSGRGVSPELQPGVASGLCWRRFGFVPWSVCVVGSCLSARLRSFRRVVGLCLDGGCGAGVLGHTVVELAATVCSRLVLLLVQKLTGYLAWKFVFILFWVNFQGASVQGLCWGSAWCSAS